MTRKDISIRTSSTCRACLYAHNVPKSSQDHQPCRITSGARASAEYQHVSSVETCQFKCATSQRVEPWAVLLRINFLFGSSKCLSPSVSHIVGLSCTAGLSAQAGNVFFLYATLSYLVNGAKGPPGSGHDWHGWVCHCSMILSRLPAPDPYGLPMGEEGEMEREQEKKNELESQKQIPNYNLFARYALFCCLVVNHYVVF